MVTVPTFLLDKTRCRANIANMVARAKAAQVILRPHFKTHQSIEVGRWFREQGVKQITVSSLRMAEYFAGDGWTDITVAFPTNILEIARIKALSAQIQLGLVVESAATAQFLGAHLTDPVNTWIKIDAGYGRTGVPVQDLAKIDALLHEIDQVPNLVARGFLAHAGHSYSSHGQEEITAVHKAHTLALYDLHQHYTSRPELNISTGDTPTCSTQTDFGPATEIRPGNFTFYDLVQAQIGSCSIEQIATAVACPVVAIHQDRNQAIIYGGGVHFSKDSFIHPDYGRCYGLIVSGGPDGWREPIANVYLGKLSQEHGTVIAPPSFIQRLAVGDILTILPAHSCMTANLYTSYQLTSGERIGRFSLQQNEST